MGILCKKKKLSWVYGEKTVYFNIKCIVKKIINLLENITNTNNSLHILIIVFILVLKFANNHILTLIVGA